MDFEWEDMELELQGEEKEEPQPKKRARKAEQRSSTGPTEEADDWGADFALADEGGEGRGEEAAPSGRPGMPEGPTTVCSDCGRVVAQNLDCCPECGAALEAGDAGGDLAEEGGPAWAGTYWGAFLYAYAAVFAANGWKSWGRYLGVGVGTPLLIMLLLQIPFIGCITGCIGFLLIPIILAGSVIGGMYFYMAHAADSGLDPVQEARPQVWADMIVPFGQVISSSNLLVVGPIIAGILLARVTGTADLAQVADNLQTAEGAEKIAILGSTIASSALIIAGVGLGVYCFPMQLMLLGASQSQWKTFNPVNMVKAIGKAPLQYTGLSIFFSLNIILTPVLLVVASFGLAAFSEIPFGGIIVLVVIVGICIYMGAVNGWRMGLFLYQNPDVFDHVR
jgi:hypothetical protein